MPADRQDSRLGTCSTNGRAASMVAFGFALAISVAVAAAYLAAATLNVARHGA